MRSLIDQIKNTERSNDKVHTNVSKILHFDRGTLFKGHSGSVYHGTLNNKDQYLNIFNKYFDVSISTEYNFESGKSTISLFIDSPTTKYMKNFIDIISNNGTIDVRAKEGSELNYAFSDHMTTIHYSLSYDGFVVFGHYDNLRLAKKLRTSLKVFKSIIRENGEDPEFCKAVVLPYKHKKHDCIALSDGLFK